MPRHPQDWDDLDDFDDEGDEDDGPDGWTVEQWEADLKRRDERDRKMSGAFLDAEGGLARMGYMREWDDEFHFSPPKNLKIAELKRVVKNFVIGKNTISKLCKPGVRIRAAG